MNTENLMIILYLIHKIIQLNMIIDYVHEYMNIDNVIVFNT